MRGQSGTNSLHASFGDSYLNGKWVHRSNGEDDFDEDCPLGRGDVGAAAWFDGTGESGRDVFAPSDFRQVWGYGSLRGFGAGELRAEF